jgi:xylulose-5-phosphate/fructose-6-phosphate phosphoketolase
MTITETAPARARHHTWTREHGEDLPEVRDWTWPHD